MKRYDLVKDAARRPGRALLLGAAVALAALLSGWVAPAQAAFPGANGRIAFEYSPAVYSDIWTMDPDGGNPLQLTTSAGYDFDPAWSPDGNRLAFVSDRDGNDEIYVMNADGRDQHNVTRDEAWDRMPAWSPDGTQIVFVSDRNGSKALYLTDLTGDHVLQLTANTSDAWFPAWSPDGNKIAFTSAGPGGGGDLMVLNLGNNRITNLTSRFDPPIDPIQPGWSPDGSRIVFADWSKPGLYLMPANGSAPPTPLAEEHVFSQSPGFSPDGEWIVFNSELLDDPTSLWLVHVKSDEVTPLSAGLSNGDSPDWQPRPANSITVEVGHNDFLPPRDWALQGSGPIGAFTLAANGGTRTFTDLPAGAYTITLTPMPGYSVPPPCQVTLGEGEALLCRFEVNYDPAASLGELAFSPYSAVFTIYADGVGLRALTGGLDLGPTWSPDGTMVAFDHHQIFAHGSFLLLADAATGTQSFVFSGQGWLNGISWSPANEKELVYSASWSGSDRLYVVNPLDYTEPREIAGAQGVAPAVSPNGNEIAYVGGNPMYGPTDILLIPSAGGAPVNLTQDAAIDGAPAWSPDGRWVVYHSAPNKDAKSDLWVVDRSGAKRRLTNTPQSEVSPAWSPDGTSIAFTQLAATQSNLFVMNADGNGSPAQVTTFLPPGQPNDPEWRPANVGALTIQVAVNGPAPAADWQFDGDLGAFTLPAAGGGRTFHNLTPGDYTITQTEQAGYTSPFRCDNGVTGAAALSLPLQRGHHVTCTVSHPDEGETMWRLYLPVGIR